MNMCIGIFCVYIYFIFCLVRFFCVFICFFFNDTATTEIYTLSLHDALPIYLLVNWDLYLAPLATRLLNVSAHGFMLARSEEHTSELQSRVDLVCRLLLEKKKKTDIY